MNQGIKQGVTGKITLKKKKSRHGLRHTEFISSQYKFILSINAIRESCEEDLY